VSKPELSPPKQGIGRHRAVFYNLGRNVAVPANESSSTGAPKPAGSRFFRRFGDDPVYERWRWQVFAITWLAYAGFNLTRRSFAVTKVELGEGTELGLTQVQLAWIDGSFLVAYAVGQFLWGIAGDRFGTRKVIAIAMFLSVLAGAAMGAVGSGLALGILFCIQGFCQSSGWGPLLKNVSEFFSRRERGFVLGLWCTNYPIGTLVASVFAGFLVQHYGWRCGFFIPAAVLLGIWCLFLWLQRDRPEDIGLPPIEQYHNEPEPVLKAGDRPEDEPEGSWKVILQVATHPTVLLLGAAYFCLKPARYAILFWGPKYVYDKLGVGTTEAGFLGALPDLAGPFSILAAGWISDRFFGTRRLPVSILCMGLLALLLLVLDRLPLTSAMLGAGLFCFGLLAYAPDALIAGIAAVDFGTKKGASTASGLINGLGSLGAIVGGVAPGFFQEKWGWQGVFTFLAMTLLLAVILLIPQWNAVPASPAGGEPKAAG
jgi:MFS transporter, OPA family, glycerol-3-phosphate transporter